MKEEVERIWDYNFWSAEKILSKLQELKNEDFLKDLGDGCGSIRDKLVHILGADKIWIERIRNEINPFLNSNEIPTLEIYVNEQKNLHSQYKILINNLDETKLIEMINYKNLKGKEFHTPLFEILLHVANHATYHRGQAASLIRRITGKPPVTDMIEYFREKIGK